MRTPDIKKLLLSRDIDKIRAGVAAAVEQDDDKVWHQLLDGVTWEPSRTTTDPQGREVEEPGRLRPNKVFAWNNVSQPWNELAMALTLAASPLPLRDEVTSLMLAKSDQRAGGAAFHLGGLGGFTNLTWLSVESAADLGGLAECRALTRLQLTQLVHPAGEMPSMVRLEELELTDWSGTIEPKRVAFASGGSWPALRSVTLVGTTLDENLLAGAPSLTTLDAVRMRALLPVISSPSVQTLNISLSDSLESGLTFSDLPACVHLSFGSRDFRESPLVVVGLPSLASLELENVAAEIRDCPAVTTLGIAGCRLSTERPLPSVSELAMTGSVLPGPLSEFLPSVTALTSAVFQSTDVPVGATAHQGEFSLDAGAVIGPLDKVATLKGMELLDLSPGAASQPDTEVSLEPLAEATELRAVGLRGLTAVTDLSPLRDLPELRFVDAFGTGVAKADLPPELKKIVSFTKKEHSLREARERPHPSTPKPRSKPSPTADLPTAARQTVAKLKKLLLSTDLTAITQGVELAVALDDDKIWHGLLDGVGFDPDAELTNRKVGRNPATTTRTVGRLRPNRIFGGGSHSTQLWHTTALAMLVANSPMPVRDEVTGLTLGDWRASGEPVELSFRGFGGFPNLRFLEVHRTAGLHDVDQLGHCPALTEIELNAPGPMIVPGMANVESLTVTGGEIITFDPSGSWPKLRDAMLGGVLNWDTFFRGAPALQRLDTGRGHPSGRRELASMSAQTWDVHFTDAGVFDVVGAPELRTLSVELGRETELKVEDCPRLERLLVGGHGGRAPVSVARCQNLQDVVMEQATPGRLVDVPRLTRLETVNARHRFDVESIRALAGIEEVHLTTLQSQRELAVPPGARPRGSHLDLRSSRRLEDLGNIAELRDLRGVFVGSRSLTTIAPLAACQDLEVVDIRGTGVADLSPLVGLPKLRAVYVAKAAVAEVPDELIDVVSYAVTPNIDSVIETLADGESLPVSRPARTALPPIEGVSTADWHNFLALLSTENFEATMAAADRAVAMGEPTIDYLLGRVSIQPDGRRIGFRGPIRMADNPLRWAFVSRLLRHAPNDSVAALALRSMNELQVHSETKHTGTVSLDDLAAFEGLRRADFSCREITSADVTDSGIETMKLQYKVLDGLRVGPALRHLQVTDNEYYKHNAFDATPLQGSAVHTLVCGRVDGAALVGCTALRRLFAVRIDNIEALHNLPLVEATDGGQPLEVWAGHPTLEVLYDRTLDEPQAPGGVDAVIKRVGLTGHSDVFRLVDSPPGGGGR